MTKEGIAPKLCLISECTAGSLREKGKLIPKREAPKAVPGAEALPCHVSVPLLLPLQALCVKGPAIGPTACN